MVLGQMAGGKPILPEMAGAVRLPVDVYWRDGIGDAGEIYPPASRRLFGGCGRSNFHGRGGPVHGLTSPPTTLQRPLCARRNNRRAGGWRSGGWFVRG